MLILFAPKMILDPPEKKIAFMDYHTTEKEKTIAF